MIYLIIAIGFLIVLEILVVKDINKLLKINSFVIIISGYLVIFGSYIVSSILGNEISKTNFIWIISIFNDRSVNRGLMMILIGGIQVILYVLFRYIKEKRINK